MRCETCHGKGFLSHLEYDDNEMPGEVVRRVERPCHECGGCGFAHCCEGERPE